MGVVDRPYLMLTCSPVVVQGAGLLAGEVQVGVLQVHLGDHLPAGNHAGVGGGAPSIWL